MLYTCNCTTTCNASMAQFIFPDIWRTNFHQKVSAGFRLHQNQAMFPVFVSMFKAIGSHSHHRFLMQCRAFGEKALHSFLVGAHIVIYAILLCIISYYSQQNFPVVACFFFHLLEFPLFLFWWFPFHSWNSCTSDAGFVLQTTQSYRLLDPTYRWKWAKFAFMAFNRWKWTNFSIWL